MAGRYTTTPNGLGVHEHGFQAYHNAGGVFLSSLTHHLFFCLGAITTPPHLKTGTKTQAKTKEQV